MGLFDLFKKSRKQESTASTSIEYNIPQELTNYIDSNIFYFSVCETKEDMKRLSLLLLTDKYEIKPFYLFYKEVVILYPTCIRSTLEQEYDLATKSARMAAKWADYEQYGDRYYLQYRTAGDEYVPDEFKLLHNITLPITDPFWEFFFPPNCYNDRSGVIQVRKEKFPLSDSKKAYELAEKAVKEPFMFNSGKNRFPIDSFLSNKTISNLVAETT